MANGLGIDAILARILPVLLLKKFNGVGKREGEVLINAKLISFLWRDIEAGIIHVVI